MGTQGSDQQLVQLLKSFAGRRQDDPAAARRAQRQLYQQLQPELDRHALNVLNFNEELARTAVQEAWLKIFRSAEHYDPTKSGVKTWAKMITGQCAIDQLRQSYRQPPTTSWDDDEVAALSCELPGPEQRAYAGQLQRVLADCIAGLPSRDGPNFRLAMELCLDPDLSHADMTAILAAHAPPSQAVKLEQVRSWLRRGRQKLDDCVRTTLKLTQKDGHHE